MNHPASLSYQLSDLIPNKISGLKAVFSGEGGVVNATKACAMFQEIYCLDRCLPSFS